MRVLIYSLARLGVLVGVGALAYLAGMRGWLWAVATVVIALLVSYPLLGRWRDQAAGQLARRRERRASAVRADDREEDEALDRAEQEETKGARG